MRHNAKRQTRRKPQGGKNNKMRVFDSNGPDARIRGTAWQVTEKYETLAMDAETSGNYVLAENYRQHAEHYQRLINSFDLENTQQREQQSNDDAQENDNATNVPQMQNVKEAELAMA
jgi:hypothetical protein